MTRTALAVVAVVFLAAGSIGHAHHSYAEFLDENVSVEGSLEKVAFANPHTVLTLRGPDAALYTATWSAAFQLDRMGVSPSELHVGDVVVITGSPSRDPAAHQMARLREVRRPRDGWVWRASSYQGPGNAPR